MLGGSGYTKFDDLVEVAVIRFLHYNGTFFSSFEIFGVESLNPCEYLSSNNLSSNIFASPDKNYLTIITLVTFVLCCLLRNMSGLLHFVYVFWYYLFFLCI